MVQIYVLVTIHFKIYSSHNVWDSSFNTEHGLNFKWSLYSGNLLYYYYTLLQSRSVNKQVLDLHCVLTYLKNKNPSLIGHGVLGIDGIYKSWIEFVGRWKNYGCPRLYFVKTDICKCYDTIIQNKLYDVMENILTTVSIYFVTKVKKLKLPVLVGPLSAVQPFSHPLTLASPSHWATLGN